jgi:hypothetical protein
MMGGHIKGADSTINAVLQPTVLHFPAVGRRKKTPEIAM